MTTSDSNRKILYIEDNYHNRRIVKKILNAKGYEVVEAENGLTGFNVLKLTKPNLVLLDINLPGIDGLEIAKRTKADPELRHIPLVALTAYALAGDEDRFLKAGCDAYLAKPTSAKALIEIVNRYYPK